ncbi:MAG: oxygen-independent coproporphyrinogen III oxidase [Hyphomicrobiales bacterium]|jgi:oxygen-independent coproporphyrinogen-3 oxidase
MTVHNIGRYATITVPRYTSYPTAPHFSSDVDGSTYTRWLSETSSNDTASLYFHVPYCRSICAYCGCFTKASRKDAPILAYGQTMAKEIDLVARHLPGKLRVTHMHWGGGTPSLMPREGFASLLKAVETHFDLSTLDEHAIELDPRVVDKALAADLKAYGVTRVSLGVQDLNARVQQAIGRVQPLEVVEGAVSALRGAGLDAINMDVMYGLPQQSLEDVGRSVAACAAMGADRIALFGYAHVPWMKKNQKMINEALLPSAGARLEQVRAAHKALEHLGYVSIGFDHFAKPEDSMAQAMRAGKLKRNFQGYTTDTATTLLGFGASSIGKLKQGYVQTAPDIGGWTRAIEAGELPVARGYALTGEDRLRGAIIEDLLTGFSTNIAEPRQGVVPSQTWINKQLIGLDDLVEDGLCEVLGTQVHIPRDARFLARLVAARFDGFAEQSKARHSVAV